MAEPADIHLYNTQSHEVERLKTLEPGKVRLYVCGVSVSGVPHVGHGRSYVVFDILRRVLEHAGYEVEHVQNFTDIEHSITLQAEKRGMSIEAFADEMIEAYFRAMDQLGILRAHHFPRVTAYLDRITEVTGTLLDHRCAYKIDDGVAFKVCDIEDFGGLLGRDPAKAVVHAVPEVAWGGRQSPFDFILWRDDDQMGKRWETPWGQGRPGWHTECAVMATDLLGDQIDIHGGGMDLIFPHHECERAIARCLTGEEFASTWVHNGLVTMEKEKMSKSLGNFVSLEEAIQAHGPAAVRAACLFANYRDTLEWTPTLLDRAHELVRTVVHVLEDGDHGQPTGAVAGRLEDLVDALRTDLRLPRAVRCLTEIAHHHADEPGSATATWQALDLLGLSELDPFTSIPRKGA